MTLCMAIELTSKQFCSCLVAGLISLNVLMIWQAAVFKHAKVQNLCGIKYEQDASHSNISINMQDVLSTYKQGSWEITWNTISIAQNAAARTRIPNSILSRFQIIDAWVQQSRARRTGHVGENNFETLTYWSKLKLFKQNIIHVCETGFNAGHSAVIFLEGDNRTVYHGWDLGTEFSAAKVVAGKLSQEYGARFHITWGSTFDTLPEYFRRERNHLCDVVVIDAEHTYKAVLFELQIFKHYLGGDWLIFVDDCHDNDIMRAFDKFLPDLQGKLNVVKYKNTPHGDLISPGFCQVSSFIKSSMW
eukprot:763124-Hanusia_phi.AAC.2